MPRACRSRSGTFGGERVGRRGVTFHTASHCGENGWAVFPPSSTLSFPAEILTLFLFFPPSFFSQTLGTVRPLANLAESITLPRNRSHFSIVCSDNFRSRGFFFWRQKYLRDLFVLDLQRSWCSSEEQIQTDTSTGYVVLHSGGNWIFSSASGICTADELLSLADASGFVGKSQDETKNGAGGPMTSSLYLNWRRLDGRQKASACLTLHTPGKGNPKVSGICLIRSSASQPGFQNVISSASQSC